MKQERLEALFNSAKSAIKNAHAPYSGCKLGAAVLMENDKIYHGTNIENASYGATVCAERVAIWNAISEGAKKIEALLIVTETALPWPPCGMCRQVIAEFATAETEIYLGTMKSKLTDLRRHKFTELFPCGFDKGNLAGTKK